MSGGRRPRMGGGVNPSERANALLDSSQGSYSMTSPTSTRASRRLRPGINRRALVGIR